MAKYSTSLGNLTFEQGLTKWTKTTEQSKNLLHALACVGLCQFRDHGDLSKLQILLDTMKRVGKNYVRIAAFEKWMAAFAPITMQDKKLVKKEGGIIDAALIEKALTVAFWEFAPDQEVSPFLATDVIAAVNNVIKRFKGQKYTPKDEEAMRTVSKLEDMMNTFQPKEAVPAE